MSRPVERYAQLLDELVLPFDLSHDFGRKRAYEATIEHAREHLADDPHCNDFLRAAAKRLGFAPISFDTIESRVRVPKGAWLDLWISDEYEEIELTGTREGFQYLIEVLTHLKGSNDPEEHVHLDRAFLPMTENSANIVLFREEESWFTGPGENGETGHHPEREMDPESVFAIQIVHFPPDDLPITSAKLYRVLRVEPVPDPTQDVKDFFGGHPDRYRRFTFAADDGQSFTYGFHLDDPGVNYFTHREIMSLVLSATRSE